MPFHVNDFIAQKEVKFEITLEKIINFPQGHKICTKNPLFDFVIIKAKDNEINI